MKKIVVYDFDGTLAYGDSLEALFINEMRGWKAMYIVYYYFLKVLSKLKLNQVKREKEQMIKLLFHSDEMAFRRACEKLAGNYKLTPIIENLRKDVAIGNRVIVLSASSEFFLNVVFKGLDIEILGMTLKCSGGTILGIDRHPFYQEKVNTLAANGIVSIDETYFDSKWDECIKPLCKHWNKVEKGYIVESSESR